MGRRAYGRYTFETSNEDKVLFPKISATKGELIEYYDRIAEHFVRHASQRALVMHRFPNGVREKGFYQKQISDHFPDWIDRVEVGRPGSDTESQQQVVCNNQATLVYLANQGVVTPHLWLSRVDELDRPDQIVVDMDPSVEGFERVRSAARWCRDLFEELGLAPFLKTTGSRGLHVMTPIRREHAFDDVRALARDIASLLARAHPDVLTTEHRKANRRGRVFLDVGRIAYGQMAVATYAVRANDDAGVAMPLEQGELEHRSLDPRAWTIRNAVERVEKIGDPWKDVRRRARSIKPVRERVDRMLDLARRGTA